MTQAHWIVVLEDNPSYFDLDLNMPVEHVTWHNCQYFIEKLNELNLGVFRLPTEAEWEYACRAGSKNAYYWGGSARDYSNIGDYAWWSGNADGRIHVVGKKKAE